MVTENVKEVRRIEIGFRTIEQGPPARYRRVTKEALMLTGDENIIDVSFIVQFRIISLPDYLFNVTDPLETVRASSESAMREVIGRTTVDDAITTGKGAIESETAQLLQRVLNTYVAGIKIENVKLQDVHPPDPVKEAFKDVTSAKEDREKMINEAHGYRNNLIPKLVGKRRNFSMIHRHTQKKPYLLLREKHNDSTPSMKNTKKRKTSQRKEFALKPWK